MIERKFWIKKLKDCLKVKNILWLTGVRRTGKTFLCKSLKNVKYYDCELPRIRKQITDTESFLENNNKNIIVLDEIHRLNNPTEILKIASDHYPEIKIIATGSSVLGSSYKFKDTLTGRKKDLWLTPMISQDLMDFKNKSLEHRFLRGGLPPFFMQKQFSESDFQEWIDSYWSKDIQELFRLERKWSFQKFLELLFIQSGGIFEATKFSASCEVSRTTILNYLTVLENTFITHVIRPFNTRKENEILSAPKVYAFDTGFVCYFKGWDKLRNDDLGLLWEHFVLNEIYANMQSRNILYWRDKRGHEVDFIIQKRNNKIYAVECKWSYNNFVPNNLRSFSNRYQNAELFVVANDVKDHFIKKFDNISVKFLNLKKLIDIII